MNLKSELPYYTVSDMSHSRRIFKPTVMLNYRQMSKYIALTIHMFSEIKVGECHHIII